MPKVYDQQRNDPQMPLFRIGVLFVAVIIAIIAVISGQSMLLVLAIFTFLAGVLSWVMPFNNSHGLSGIEKYTLGSDRIKYLLKFINYKQQYIWTIPRPVSRFTGRGEILRQMHDDRYREIVLSGMKGIGTTQIAQAYAHRHRSQYRSGLFLRCPSSSFYEHDLKAIGEALELEEDIIGDIAELRKKVLKWLAKNHGWVLILDSCDPTNDAADADLIKAICALSTAGKIIMTTSQHDINTSYHTIHVGAFKREESKIFLLYRSGFLQFGQNIEQLDITGKNFSKQELLNTIDSLAGELGDLPEALEYVGRYIDAVYGPSVYDRLQQCLTFISQPSHIDEIYQATFEQTRGASCLLSYMKVMGESRSAAKFLLFCAILADVIPFDFIERIVKRQEISDFPLDEVELNRATGILHKFSLIRRESVALVMNVHVQKLLRSRISEKDRRECMEQAIAAIAAMFPDVTTSSMAKAYQPYEKLVLSCVEYIREMAVETAAAAQLLDGYGCYLGSYARYAEAESMFKASQSIYHKLPPTSDILRMLDANKEHMADIDQSQGKYVRAKQGYEAVLKNREDRQGKDHHDVAFVRSKLAIVYSNLSIQQMRNAETEFDEQLVREYQRKAIQFHQASQAYHQQALDIFNEVTKLCTQPYPFTMVNIFKQLGFTYTQIDNTAQLTEVIRYQKAVENYRSALVLYERQRQQLGRREKLLDEELCRLNLARSECHIQPPGEKTYHDAEVCYKHVLQVYIDAFGKEHPQVADIHYNMAELYVSLAKLQHSSRYCKRYYQDALNCFREACTIYQQKMPKNALVPYIDEQILQIQKKLRSFS